MNAGDAAQAVTGAYALPGDILQLKCDHEDLAAGFYVLLRQRGGVALLCLAGEGGDGILCATDRAVALPALALRFFALTGLRTPIGGGRRAGRE